LWLPLCLLGTCPYFALLKMLPGLSLRLTEISKDIEIYLTAEEAILAGEAAGQCGTS